MKFLIFIPFLINVAISQELNDFNAQRSAIDKKLMLTLGGWSVVNLIGSGIGWTSSVAAESKYFHQMNVMWNAVNLGLAIPGYYKTKKLTTEMTIVQTMREQNRAEKLFLFNAGLDLTYMTTGFFLRNEAKYNAVKKDQLMGYGNSLMLQGGFLFLFDIAAYAIHVHHANKKLYPILQHLSLDQSSIGLRFGLR